jgi:hypothetical protein
MNTWMRLAWLCALSGATLLGCDGGEGDTDGGPQADSGPGTDGGEECAAEVTVSGTITEDTEWSCPVYVLSGRVFVENDATLTIAAGATILGDSAGDEAGALIVTRGSRLVAEGTAADPIVFTSAAPEAVRQTGDWGGVVLLGSATTNDGSCVNDGNAATADVCDAPGYLEDRIEGIETGEERALYGGTDDTSDCGTLRYVRIEYAGREFSPDNELNGLTVGACGSGTDLSYIQVHRGKDDGVELFGGTASMHHVIISGASDDGLDFDEGWRGNVQFLVIHQYEGIGDRGFEADNLGSVEAAEPRTKPTMWNVTMIGTTSNGAMLLREGMQGRLHNFVISTYGSAPDVQGRQVDPSTFWPNDLVIEHSFFHAVADFPAEDLDAEGVWDLARTMDGTLPATRPGDLSTLTAGQRELIADLEVEHLDDDMGFDEEAAMTDAARNNTFDADPMLGSASTTAPDYVPSNTALNGQGTPAFNSFAPSGFGDASATYAGAFEPAGTNWAEGWTAFP